MSTKAEILAIRVNMAAQFWYAQHVYGAALITLQVVMCAKSLKAYQALSQEQRRTRRLYIVMSFVMFFLDLIMRLSFEMSNFRFITSRGTTAQKLALSAANADMWSTIVGSWAAMFIPLLGDGLMVYRCYIVWTGQRFITILPAAVVLANFIINLYSSIVTTSGIHATIPNGLIYAFVAFEVISNCLVTLLIGWRLLWIRHRQSGILQDFDGSVHLQAVSIVAESALPLALSAIFVGICWNKVSDDPTHWRQWSIASKVATGCYDIFSILSFQIIIWRVALGHSFAHSNKKSTLISALAFRRSGVKKGSSDSDISESKIEAEVFENNSSEKATLPIV